MRTVLEKDVVVSDAVKVLKNGGLVIYPTETLYGAGVDATNEKAVKKLSLFKKRPAGKPFSIAVTDVGMAKKYSVINSSAVKIYNTFLPGPVTIISKGKHILAKGVESENGNVGIRVPDYQLIRNIIKDLDKPITATSANASYKKRPYNISDILDNLSDKQKSLIDYIIDGGDLPHREPSTVVDTTIDDVSVLRQGNVKLVKGNHVLSVSPESTEDIAKNILQKYETYFGNRAIIFALKGDMGVGKTIFTKGLAKTLGITQTVSSPTFNLLNSYLVNSPVRKLTHIDVWRIRDANELSDINLVKEISDKSVVSIEWADKISEEIRKYHEEAIIIWVKIRFGKKMNNRFISWGVSK